MSTDVIWCISLKGAGDVTAEDGPAEVASADDFSVEYASSGRAKCRGCDDKISKVSLLYLFRNTIVFNHYFDFKMALKSLMQGWQKTGMSALSGMWNNFPWHAIWRRKAINNQS